MTDRAEPALEAALFESEADRAHGVGVTQRRAVFAASLGNAVEFYDWAVYGTLVAVFAPQFFASGRGVTSLLSALAVFAVGFIARPVGAILLGSYADRVGRRHMLILSISITSIAALLIALIPPYSVIGVWAPLLLVVARLAQGFAAGGESAGSMTYIAESAGNGRRGFVGSFQQVSTTVGLLLASLVGTVLTITLPQEALGAWGWRVAFLLAAALGVVAFFMRRTAEETNAFRRAEKSVQDRKRPSAIDVFRRNPKQMLQVFGLGIPATIVNYLWLNYMPTLAHTIGGIPLDQALLSNTITLVLTCVILPVCGRFSDRFGRKINLFIFTVGFILFSYPAMLMIGLSFTTLLIAQIIGAVLLAFDGAIITSQYNELFPVETRAAGVAIPYAISVALFGGTAPYIVTWLFSVGLGGQIWIYVAVSAAIGLVTLLTLPETFRRSL